MPLTGGNSVKNRYAPILMGIVLVAMSLGACSSHTSAATINPGTIQALHDVNAKCSWADPRGTNPPSLQDDGTGVQSYGQMPANPSDNTVTCAIARAKAAGYSVVGNSVTCAEKTIELLDGKTLRTFNRPLCVNVGTHSDPTCTITLVPVDYQGNFLWDEQPDLSRLQNVGESYVADLGSFASC